MYEKCDTLIILFQLVEREENDAGITGALCKTILVDATKCRSQRFSRNNKFGINAVDWGSGIALGDYRHE